MSYITLYVYFCFGILFTYYSLCNREVFKSVTISDLSAQIEGSCRKLLHYFLMYRPFIDRNLWNMNDGKATYFINVLCDYVGAMYFEH